MFCRTATDAGTWDEKEAVIWALLAPASQQHKGGEQTAPGATGSAPGSTRGHALGPAHLMPQTPSVFPSWNREGATFDILRTILFLV